MVLVKVHASIPKDRTMCWRIGSSCWRDSYTSRAGASTMVIHRPRVGPHSLCGGHSPPVPNMMTYSVCVCCKEWTNRVQGKLRGHGRGDKDGCEDADMWYWWILQVYLCRIPSKNSHHSGFVCLHPKRSPYWSPSYAVHIVYNAYCSLFPPPIEINRWVVRGDWPASGL